MDNDTKAAAHRAHDNRTTYFRSLHQARIADARPAVQTSLWVNGLGATALLAFLGSLSTGATARHAPHAVVWSLALFGAGVFFAAAAAVSSYVANSGYAEAVGAKLATWTHPYEESTKEARQHERRAWIAHRIGYGCAAGTLLSFLAVL